MSNIQRQLLIVGILGLTFLGACTAGLQTTWNDPYYKSKRFKNIIILELAEDQGQSQIFEASATAFFNKKGINAIPIHNKMKSDTAFKYYQFEMKFDSLGIDGILVFRKIAAKESEFFTPEPVNVFPQYYFNYYTYYLNNYNMIHSPKYRSKAKNLKIETNFYSNRGDMLVWTAQSNSFKVENTQKFAESLAKKVFRELKRKKLI